MLIYRPCLCHNWNRNLFGDKTKHKTAVYLCLHRKELCKGNDQRVFVESKSSNTLNDTLARTPPIKPKPYAFYVSVPAWFPNSRESATKFHKQSSQLKCLCHGWSQFWKAIIHFFRYRESNLMLQTQSHFEKNLIKNIMRDSLLLTWLHTAFIKRQLSEPHTRRKKIMLVIPHSLIKATTVDSFWNAQYCVCLSLCFVVFKSLRRRPRMQIEIPNVPIRAAEQWTRKLSQKIKQRNVVCIYTIFWPNSVKLRVEEWEGANRKITLCKNF